MESFYEALVINLKVVSPSEFWGLTPNEAGLIIDWHVENSERSKPMDGKLTDAQIEHLDNRRAKLRGKGLKVL